MPIEQDVLAATGRAVRGIVLRPATVYGRGGGAFQPLVAMAHRAGIARYIGAGTNRHVTIHVDDLAALYVLALERAPSGTVLNAAAGAVAMKDLTVAISHAIGRPGAVAAWTIEEASAALGGCANFFALNHQVSHARAILLLEWDPRASSPLYNVAYGSYRSRAADDLPPLSDPASAMTITFRRARWPRGERRSTAPPGWRQHPSTRPAGRRPCSSYRQRSMRGRASPTRRAMPPIARRRRSQGSRDTFVPAYQAS